MRRTAYAYGKSTAGQVVASGYIAVELGTHADDARAENFPSMFDVYEIEVTLSALVAAKVAAGEELSAKLSWTSTENARNLSNVDTQDLLLIADESAGSAVFSLRSPLRVPSDISSYAGKLYLWLKLSGTTDATVTATATVRARFTTEA